MIYLFSPSWNIKMENHFNLVKIVYIIGSHQDIKHFYGNQIKVLFAKMQPRGKQFIIIFQQKQSGFHNIKQYNTISFTFAKLNILFYQKFNLKNAYFLIVDSIIKRLHGFNRKMALNQFIRSKKESLFINWLKYLLRVQVRLEIPK